MKIFTLSLGLIFILVLARCGSPEPANHPDLDAAFIEAAETSKPILIDFNTEWCPPCQKFAKDAHKDTGIMEALDQVILVKIDCEKDEGVDLARSYEVESYPTFQLLDADGNSLGRWVGYQKGMFIQELTQALEEAVP